MKYIDGYTCKEGVVLRIRDRVYQWTWRTVIDRAQVIAIATLGLLVLSLAVILYTNHILNLLQVALLVFIIAAGIILAGIS